MTKTSIELDQLLMLLEQRIRKGACVPFLGAGVNASREFDLQLKPSLNDVSGIPTEGKHLIIVAAVNNVLHFRIFDGDGEKAVDTDEKRLTEQARQIEDLREQLKSLWPLPELPSSDKGRVVTAVKSIVGYTPSRGEEYKGLPLGGEVAFRLVEMILGLTEVELKELKNLVENLAEFNAHKKFRNSKYYKDFTRLGLQNLAQVALRYEHIFDFPALMDRLNSIIPDDQCEPSRPLEILARLPFKLIVTTNYDGLMEKALDKINRKYEPVVQPVCGFSVQEQHDWDDRICPWWKSKPKQPGDLPNLILYKIHGTFKGKTSGKPASPIIITEDDYIEFLTVVGKTEASSTPCRDEKFGVPQEIKAELATSTLLFLGYSLEDWDFRTIFKGLIEKLGRYDQFKSFAIQKEPSDFWREFWKSKKVEICDMDVFDFAVDLYQKYEEYRKDQAK